VGFAGDGRFEIVRSTADGQASSRVAGFFQVFEVAVGVAGFAFRGGAEYGVERNTAATSL
jgi:hypothetical protein